MLLLYLIQVLDSFPFSILGSNELGFLLLSVAAGVYFRSEGKFIAATPTLLLVIMVINYHLGLKNILLYLLWLVPLIQAVFLPWRFSQPWQVCVFVPIFVWRYWRFMVSIFCHIFVSRSVPIPTAGNISPVIKSFHVTVIIPSVNPDGEDFVETLISVLKNKVDRIIVSTVNNAQHPDRLDRAIACINILDSNLLVSGRVQVIDAGAENANKRGQVVAALKLLRGHEIRDGIVVLADDHVKWPDSFIPTIIAPFEDHRVGGVACQKVVKRTYGRLFSVDDVLNFIGCLYLERHNFDLAATNAVDGSVFVISGRTCAYRASIVCHPELWHTFTNETFWGKVKNLPEDDNFLTRWLVTKGWKIRFVTGPSATIVATIGNEGLARFSSQVGRWTRTTWRSNTTSLLVDRTVWTAQPWGVYAIYLTSWFNFAAPVDFILMLLSYYAAEEAEIKFLPARTAVTWMAMLICLSKLAKTYPHYERNPRDAFFYIPVAIAFSYLHSFIKFWCLCTISRTAWGARPGMGLPVVNAHTEVVHQRKSSSRGSPTPGGVVVALCVSIFVALWVGHRFHDILDDITYAPYRT